LDFLLFAKNKYGHNPLHSVAFYRCEDEIRIFLAGVRERGWRRAKGQEEWRNSLDNRGLTALHIAIAFPAYSGMPYAGTVGALLSPVGEGEARGGGKRKQHPDEEEQEEDEEDRRKREERRYEGGVDPNKGCKGRTAEWVRGEGQKGGENVVRHALLDLSLTCIPFSSSTGASKYLV
jgi:hypothetical protein